MKKLYILLLVLLSYEYSNAQEIKLGVKAGANISNIALESGNLNNKILFHVGILSKFKLSEKVIIQPEILYSQQGAQNEGQNQFSQSTNKIDYTLNYINIPVYLNYEINDSFSINIGPQIGFLINSELKFSTSESSTPGFPTEVVEKNPDFYENTSFGFNGGISYLIDDLILSANYNFGITDINNSDELNLNRVFQVSIGYFFL